MLLILLECGRSGTWVSRIQLFRQCLKVGVHAEGDALLPVVVGELNVVVLREADALRIVRLAALHMFCERIGIVLWREAPEM